MTKITAELLLSRKADLLATRSAVEKEAAPLRAKREKLIAKLHPLEAEIRDLSDAIKKIEQPLYEIDMERSLIAKALPGNRGIKATDSAITEAKA